MNDQDLLRQALARQVVLKELQAAALAELAMLSDDPVARLEQILGHEEGASMNAAGHVDLDHPAVRLVVEEMESFRASLFDLSRKALSRMLQTRSASEYG
jgi:hypothetical protein